MAEANRGMGKLIGRLRTAHWRQLVFGSITLIAGYACLVATLAGMWPSAPHFGPLVVMPLLLLDWAARGWDPETDWYAEGIAFRHGFFACVAVWFLYAIPGLALWRPRDPADFWCFIWAFVAIVFATRALLSKLEPEAPVGDFATHPA